MNRLLKLLPASFKDVPFLVRAEAQTEGGRRLVLHDYPNSNKRFIEDLGRIPNKFSITAFVTGHNFQYNADRLEAVLKESGAGVLVMPTFGRANLYALPYKKDTSQQAVGEIKFELTFIAGTAFSGPISSPDSPETVYVKGDAVREKTAESLETLWKEPKETTNAISAEYDLKEYARAIGKLVTAIDEPVDLEGTIDLILLNSPPRS